jgi:hypothetical protein
MFSGNLMPHLTQITLCVNHPIRSMHYFPIIATILRIYSLAHICNSERDVAVIKAFFLFLYR